MLLQEETQNLPLYNDKRVLQVGSTAAKMRVTYNASGLQDLSQNKQNSIIKQLDISVAYLGNLLSVYPETGNIQAPVSCADLQTSSADQTTGISNTDLHIYVTHFNDPNDGALAWASLCKRRNDRPIMGRIHYNDYLIPENQTNPIFEEQWDTTIHEIFHILGFAGWEIKNFHDPDTGIKYTESALANVYNPNVIIRGTPTPVLSTPTVLQITKSHYNCQSAAGMQLENNGELGSIGAHWERSIIQNEFMTANSVTSDSQLTSFSLAFLKDTNWYADVNMTMGETTPWGKGKGCDFLNLACTGSTNFDEFEQNDNVDRCTFFGHAFGQASVADPFVEGSCFYSSEFSNTDCRTGTFDSQMGQLYGLTSMCVPHASIKIFQNQLNALQNPACYPMQCNSAGSQITVTVGNGTVVCTTNGAVMTIPDGAGIWGSITCPNIDFYCNQTPKPCQDYCNQSGYCLNGACTCLPGVSGSNCQNGSITTQISSTNGTQSSSTNSNGNSNTNNNITQSSTNTTLSTSIQMFSIPLILLVSSIII